MLYEGKSNFFIKAYNKNIIVNNNALIKYFDSMEST